MYKCIWCIPFNVWNVAITSRATACRREIRNGLCIIQQRVKASDFCGCMCVRMWICVFESIVMNVKAASNIQSRAVKCMNIMRSIKWGQKSNLWICFGRQSHVTSFSRRWFMLSNSENANICKYKFMNTHKVAIEGCFSLSSHHIHFGSRTQHSYVIIIVSKMELIFALILLYNIAYFSHYVYCVHYVCRLVRFISCVVWCGWEKYIGNNILLYLCLWWLWCLSAMDWILNLYVLTIWAYGQITFYVEVYFPYFPLYICTTTHSKYVCWRFF